MIMYYVYNQVIFLQIHDLFFMFQLLFSIHFLLIFTMFSFLRLRVEVGLGVYILILSSSGVEAAPRWHNTHGRLTVSELYLYLLLAIS